MSDCDRHSNFFPMMGGMILGGMLGAGAMYFLSPRSGKANRKIVKDRVDELSDYLLEEKELLEEKVQDIFGDVNEITTSLFNDARKLWDSQVRTFEKSMGQINKVKYQEMVDNVMEKLQTNHKYTDSDLTKMKRYLSNQWRQFSSMME